jgi:hypothetical protein
MPISKSRIKRTTLFIYNQFNFVFSLSEKRSQRVVEVIKKELIILSDNCMRFD